MASRRTIITLSALVAIVAAWYAFRPERLFLNTTVSEAVPAASQAQAAVPSAPVPPAAGRFHTNGDETKRLAPIYPVSDGKRVLRLAAVVTSNGPGVHA